MRNQNQRTAKLQQTLLQYFKGGDVEIIGGFVQQEHIGRLKHELSDQDSRPFASGEPFDRLVKLLAGEQKFCRPRGHVNDPVLINDRIAFRSQRTPQCHVGIEFTGLIEVHDTQPLGPTNLTIRGGQLSAQKPQQRGLAAAIRAHQAYPHPGSDDEVEFVEEGAIFPCRQPGRCR